ncbi:hypothetical protein DFJ43DRAFT_1053260 [Lentinula guzmanii]|uniref:Uncharacterized protein n=1 Tax=Lentinula guzmanii TaxID=2804957 RepID=A0AA38JV38_9AGAR|nr:hypothetical protein DFJ43DRAFT_1053260 [Lentinula guzmanii]
MSINHPRKQPQASGSGYGEIRASLDVDKLERYPEKNLKGVMLPLAVKQFKVMCYAKSIGSKHFLCSMDNIRRTGSHCPALDSTGQS